MDLMQPLGSDKIPAIGIVDMFNPFIWVIPRLLEHADGINIFHERCINPIDPFLVACIKIKCDLRVESAPDSSDRSLYDTSCCQGYQFRLAGCVAAVTLRCCSFQLGFWTFLEPEFIKD